MEAFESILERARQGDKDALGCLLNRHRDRLRALADQNLAGRLQVRVDASDIAQRTILSGFGKFQDFQGSNEQEWLAWLERILSRNVLDTIRMHHRAEKRAISREVALDDWDDIADTPTTSAMADRAVIRSEDAEWLIKQIDALPPDQAFAVRMRHFEGEELAHIAMIMGRTKVSVAGLIKRGLERLRQQAGNM